MVLIIKSKVITVKLLTKISKWECPAQGHWETQSNIILLRGPTTILRTQSYWSASAGTYNFSIQKWKEKHNNWKNRNNDNQPMSTGNTKTKEKKTTSEPQGGEKAINAPIGETLRGKKSKTATWPSGKQQSNLKTTRTRTNRTEATTTSRRKTPRRQAKQTMSKFWMGFEGGTDGAGSIEERAWPTWTWTAILCTATRLRTQQQQHSHTHTHS